MPLGCVMQRSFRSSQAYGFDASSSALRQPPPKHLEPPKLPKPAPSAGQSWLVLDSSHSMVN